MGILSSKTFWLSKSDFLNDYSELNYIIELLLDIVIDIINSKYEIEGVSFQDTIKFSESILGVSELLVPSITNQFSIFVLSMTENNDSLALWANYSNHVGYNIGIDKNRLKAYVKNHLSKGILNPAQKPEGLTHIVTGLVEYDLERQTQIILEEITILYNLLSSNDNPELLSDYYQNFLIMLFCYAPFFKKSVFRQEEEYRIVYVSNSNDFSNIKIRPSNGILIPFVELQLQEDFVLKQIGIGPKNNLDIANLGVEIFLRQQGYPMVNVKKSDITLRF